MAKPRPDHPWILRTSAQVRAQKAKKVRSDRANLAFQALREEEEASEREEASDIERACREFFYS